MFHFIDLSMPNLVRVFDPPQMTFPFVSLGSLGQLAGDTGPIYVHSLGFWIFGDVPVPVNGVCGCVCGWWVLNVCVVGGKNWVCGGCLSL